MAGVSIGNAVAYLTADRAGLTRELRKAEQQIETGGNRFGSVLQGVGMSVGMGVAGVLADTAMQVQAYLGDSVQAASSLNETVSKTGVLFGESTGAVLAWSQTAATAMGQSQQQALDAAAQFAIFGDAAGLAGDDLVGFSTDFTALASDLASFHNTSPEQAIEAIGAALRGEAEPMRKFGVLLDDATLKAKALELGIYDGSGALTQQQKILAAQAAIYEQTTAAQGDFARTSGGLANQQRILDAQWANMQATIGEALLPVMTTLITSVNGLVQSVLPPLTAFIREQVTPAFQSLATVIGPAIQTVIGWFGQWGQVVQGTADGPLAYLMTWVGENLPRVQRIVEGVLNAVSAFWGEWGDEIRGAFEVYVAWLSRFWNGVFETLLDIVTLFLQVLEGDWEGAGETIKGIVGRWWEFIQDAFFAIRDTITRIDWGAVGRTVINGIWSGLKAAWAFISDWTTDRVVEFGKWFTEIDWGGIGKAMVDGIWQGMRDNWGGLQQWFQDRLQDMQNLLPHSEPKDPSSPLRGLPERGAAIVEMLQRGIAEAGALMAPRLDMGPAYAGAGAGGPLNITINVTGMADGAAVGRASRDGVLSALRSAGLR